MLLFYNLIDSETFSTIREVDGLESDVLSSITILFHKSRMFVNDSGMTLSS
jgi:hypothetical protein